MCERQNSPGGGSSMGGGGGGGVRTQPTSFWETSKLQKEGKNVVCVRANVPRLST